MPYAGVGGRRLYYEVGGEGETVVLLHGSFANADILEGPATAISSGFRAVRFDRRGTAARGDAAEPLPLAEEAAEIAAFLDWFSTEKAHLLAHDDGSEIALQFALDFPDRTLSLAFLAPTLEGFPWREETRAARRAPPRDFRARSRSARSRRRGSRRRVFDVARENEVTFERLEDIYGTARVAGGSLERPPHPGPSQAQRLGEIHAQDDGPRRATARSREHPVRFAPSCAGSTEPSGSTFPGLARFLHMEDGRHVMRRLTDFYIPPEEDVKKRPQRMLFRKSLFVFVFPSFERSSSIAS